MSVRHASGIVTQVGSSGLVDVVMVLPLGRSCFTQLFMGIRRWFYPPVVRHVAWESRAVQSISELI